MWKRNIWKERKKGKRETKKQKEQEKKLSAYVETLLKRKSRCATRRAVAVAGPDRNVLALIKYEV